MTEPVDFDPLVDELPSRYIVGIDLGTTNSAVSFVDTQQDPWHVAVLPIPQLVAAGEVESRDTLPSFHYQATGPQAADGALRLPWSTQDPGDAVGVYAREQGTQTPGRLIASAKSWLCHSGVDRTAELLPWQGAEDVDRMSPVTVTANYLRHIREAWNAAHPQDALAEQQVVITLPASFDEVARELTVEAATAAGLPRIVLIEEPQAAFYAWVYRHAADWQNLVAPGQKILICDIGGGTTDFTLIHARQNETTDGDKVQFHRVAVGNHLILGGDNLDLALAHHVEEKLAGDKKLSAQQWDVLVRSARRVKETLLGNEAPHSVTLHLPGAGAKLIGGGLQTEVTRAEAEQLFLEGFLPHVKFGDKPQQRQSGFQEFGLPYAADHAITRYLSAFLSAHRETGDTHDSETPPDSGHPDIILFNGGFFHSAVLRDRLLEILSDWFRPALGDNWSPQVLANDRLDLAVSCGAAYYGMVQRGAGVRIAANLARAYYIGVEHAAGPTAQAVCLVPGDAETGCEIELPEQEFQLTISEPVEFPLYVSSTRLTDQPGEVITIDPEQVTPLPPIRTVLRTTRRSERGTVPVHLHARLSEIGTIELWCSQVGSERTWRLQFDIRAATQTDIAAHVSGAESEGFLDEAQWDACRDCLASVFAPDGEENPTRLMKRLAKALDSDKSQWPTSLVRRMWDVLMELESGRRRSAEHEARWLNLLGYALRPGYGFAMDDWRVSETWRTVRNKLVFGSADQALILWRRVAGGLSRGQQQAIAESSLAAIRNLHRRFNGGPQRGSGAAVNIAASVEMWRLLGSLELLPIPLKIELGNAIVTLLTKRKLAKAHDAMVWALGRVGQRVPIYGPLNTVVPQSRAAEWVEALLARTEVNATDLLAAMQLSRLSGDRNRDLPEDLRNEVCDWLEHHDGPQHLVQLVREGGSLDRQEQNQVIGEALPRGLRIVS